jgi:hypothetical protein
VRAAPVSTDILATIDGALDFDTGTDAMRWRPGGKRKPVPTAAVSATAVAFAVTVDARDFTRALSEVIEVVNRAVRPAFLDAAKGLHALSAAFFPEQHRRCRACHPQWKPLAVDGREYHRRQQARRRRKR